MKSVSRFAFVAGVAWLLMALLPARADDQAGGAPALLARAQQLEDLRADGAVPFVLHAQIKATRGKQRVDGTYSLTWLDANRWHEELVLADFRRIRDGVEGGYLQVRNSDSPQEVIFRVDQTLDITKAMQLSPEAQARDVRRHKIGGAVLACVEFRSRDSMEKDLCFDPMSGLLVRSKLKCPGWETDCTVDYAGSVELGDRRFPSQIRSRSPDELSIEITVASLKAFSGSAVSLPVADPARSEFWRACRDEIPAKAVNIPPLVVFVKANNRWGELSVVLLYARIEPDGTVSHVTLLTPDLWQFESAARDAATGWKFEPAMCSAEPVRIETLIAVTFGVGGPP
jgi:hypothetical protein